MRVLLPVDSSEERAVAAVEAVLSLPNVAETVQATVLNVEKEVQVSSDAIVESKSWYDPDEIPTSVDMATAMLEDAGVPVEKRRIHGDPAAAIVEVADEIDADRIVIAGRKRTPVGKVLFGSVAQSVLLNSNRPVTFVAA